MDPDTSEVTQRFHPSLDPWSDHSRLHGGQVIGLTAVGRTTAWLLKMNEDGQAALRAGE